MPSRSLRPRIIESEIPAPVICHNPAAKLPASAFIPLAKVPRRAGVKRERPDSSLVTTPRKKQSKATDDGTPAERKTAPEMASEEYYRAGDKAQKALPAADKYRSTIDATSDRMVAMNREQEAALQKARDEIDKLKAQEQDTLGKLRDATTKLRRRLGFHMSALDTMAQKEAAARLEQDAVITALNAQLAEKDAVIAAQSAELTRKATATRAQGADLAEKAADLAEKAADLAEKAANLSEEAAAITAQGAKLCQKDANLSEKNAMISTKKAVTATKKK
ncbi:hypothetical protein MAPG_11229 [Magnaporthiopsis poae ATCC 64411]|uniref:Uncharacterized protein n=1 Tax=Magnaporthiopsis poae (strain ATCC 64411 / 73-15) TaxID=644358 RepID=A0A0C4EEQ4_MAGP6|nr:hypothetical protein MAPG_11229 [Magnaporthiopsis poae ATCC 64411]